LGLDAGYLSRILRGFHARGLVGKKRSESDGRQSLLALTKQGQAAFARLDAKASAEVAAQLKSLSPGEQHRLVAALRQVEAILGKRCERPAPVVLRPHRPGDMGWVVHRHGVLYAREYGYDERFDPKHERCWIAEQDGEILGSIFLVKKTAAVAKLRLLLVEPKARGLGLGKNLVEECVRFARQAGYRKITLWTQSDLYAARAIYRKTGFRRVNEEKHHSFGKDLVAETWELGL
jgi:GNAT superfamily N-acetyltransferase